MTPTPANPWFRMAELRRVGTAATMIVVCGTIIIVTVTMMIGHYNPLVHCAPKAAVDGAAIALLIGQRGRWRCLALLGTVYGLVLLLQVGVFYLFPVMAVAGLLAASAGRVLDLLNRRLALLLATPLYELLAGFGTPIKIYFGTGGHTEPFVWGLWFAEWPLRLIGAAVGVWLALRWLERRTDSKMKIAPSSSAKVSLRRLAPRARGIGQAAVRLIACMIACTLPLWIESHTALAVIAAAFVFYAFAVGVRRAILPAILGLLWGWILFGSLSYAWNRDFNRVLDLSRTLVLRFLPIAMASTALVTTARPVDLIRLLRACRVSPAILIPLATVTRAIPRSRRDLRHSIEALREQGHWTSPFSLLRHPSLILRQVLGPQVKRWASELAED